MQSKSAQRAQILGIELHHASDSKYQTLNAPMWYSKLCGSLAWQGGRAASEVQKGCRGGQSAEVAVQTGAGRLRFSKSVTVYINRYVQAARSCRKLHVYTRSTFSAYNTWCCVCRAYICLASVTRRHSRNGLHRPPQLTPAPAPGWRPRLHVHVFRTTGVRLQTSAKYSSLIVHSSPTRLCTCRRLLIRILSRLLANWSPHRHASLNM